MATIQKIAKITKPGRFKKLLLRHMLDSPSAFLSDLFMMHLLLPVHRLQNERRWIASSNGGSIRSSYQLFEGFHHGSLQ
jgi:hypothetical protein